MNPFERVAELLINTTDPVTQEVVYMDTTREFVVKLTNHDGRRVTGVSNDLAMATQFAVDGWDDVNPFASARKLMARELKDENLRIGYVANIAMLLYDRYQGADWVDQDIRESAAEDILKKIFED